MQQARQVSDPETVERLVKRGTSLLKAFHEDYAKDPVSRETEPWRGNVSGWRHTLDTFYGTHSQQIVDRVRRETNLPIPQCGMLAPDGKGYLGFDSGADVF